jgi:hypothetical protein
VTPAGDVLFKVVDFDIWHVLVGGSFCEVGHGGFDFLTDRRRA